MTIYKKIGQKKFRSVASPRLGLHQSASNPPFPLLIIGNGISSVDM